LNLGRLSRDERPRCRAWWASGTADGHDVPDLGEREAEALGLGDEGQHAERIVAVQPVAGGCASGGPQDARGLVEPQRLAGDSGAGGELADAQSPVSVAHARTINPAPRGRVKSVAIRETRP
jgi:hypothetical protein